MTLHSAAQGGRDGVKKQSKSFLPQHNRQYLDAAYWDERFLKVRKSPLRSTLVECTAVKCHWACLLLAMYLCSL